LLSALVDWAGWEIQRHHSDHRHDFDSRHLHELVGAKPGPVLVVGKLKWQAVQALREQLLLKYAVVVCEAPTELDHVLDQAREAMARHGAGDPRVPRRLVVTLRVLRKLVRGGYWGGESKNKAYIWPDEIAKGRGVDEKYRADAKEVANTLINLGWMRRVKKQGSWKWCLNIDFREDIHAFLNTRATTNQTLSAYLHKAGLPDESARELDFLDQDDSDDE
jgi:hypothetical protein